MWMKPRLPFPGGQLLQLQALVLQGREYVLRGGGRMGPREPEAAPGVSGFTTG